MSHNHTPRDTMKTKPFFLVCLAAFASAFTVGAASSQLLGWNNLGMHCMDSDYSVFSVLPPYNTIEAQLGSAPRAFPSAPTTRGDEEPVSPHAPPGP